MVVSEAMGQKLAQQIVHAIVVNVVNFGAFYSVTEGLAPSVGSIPTLASLSVEWAAEPRVSPAS
jgi:hypothetical protein